MQIFRFVSAYKQIDSKLLESQHTMTPDRIDERAKAIRLPVKELASAAGVHEDTAHRVLKGMTDARTSTVDKLSGALLKEEERLRSHLDDVAEGDGE